MKIKNILIIFLCTLGILCTSCQRNAAVAWEDAKTAGRYLKLKTEKFLWNKENESRLVQSEEEFYGPSEEEFIPLKHSDLKNQYAEFAAPQSKESPGLPGSKIPSIEKFLKPTSELAAIFRNVYFNTDDHVLREKNYYDTLAKIADFLKGHRDMYVFIEGHTDERASEAYNLALGTRRCNFIRNQLIKRGVSPDQLFTISYGKEKPVDPGHSKEAWSKNRRSEFKIFKLAK